MTLKVIGAGFGRTGTLSLKIALEQLELGPCYHMSEIHQAPQRAAKWREAADGGKPDWDGIFDGYASTVDWPAAHYWRELADYYPEAKVLLSHRDAKGWYKSISNTIHKVMQAIEDDGSSAFKSSPAAMAAKIVKVQTFQGRLGEESYAIDVFEKHNQAVRDTIAPERLLVYQSGDGWEPICNFLGVPVPKSDYPRTNSTQEFYEQFVDFGEKRDE